MAAAVAADSVAVASAEAAVSVEADSVAAAFTAADSTIIITTDPVGAGGIVDLITVAAA